MIARAENFRSTLHPYQRELLAEIAVVAPLAQKMLLVA
jgi:hypothetical protein